jgi:hypothetical protein
LPTDRSGIPLVVDIEPGLDCVFIWRPGEDYEYQPYVAEWLRANGIDINVVSVGEDIYIDNGRVFYTEHKLNAEGCKYVDPATDEVAQRDTWRVITVPFGK